MVSDALYNQEQQLANTDAGLVTYDLLLMGKIARMM
jgi:hypothetical protein